MTRPTNDRTERNADRRTMGEIDHTNPYTGETAGQLFSRGPTVVTDGGEPSRTPDDHRPSESDPSATDSNGESDDQETMKDVNHTPPKNAEDTNRVFERGRKPNTVGDEE
ncbi:hypothetical protein [Natronorubrum halophilum]|uniref:hypothetical protein n=1 Tax=Natronorubrum halophilum TaxID=1702106 RepID=UPI000EF6C2D8|nr:hypothetical protein [Natronorubrum halophilum]